MSDPNQQQTICYNGVCRVKGIGDDPFVYDGAGNVVGVATYGTLGGTAPQPTAGGTSGFGGSSTVYYPADPVPPAAVGVPTPPTTVKIVVPGTGYVRIDEGFFGSDGELHETGWLSPHQVTQRLPDGNSWSGFGEVMTPDTYMATVSGATGTQLLARDFRVNLPSEASVVSIDIEVNGRVLQGGPEDDAVKLIYCGAESITGGGPPSLAGTYGPFSYDAVANGMASSDKSISTSTKVAFMDPFGGQLDVWDQTTDTLDTVTTAISFGRVFQANDNIYVIVASSGEVYHYTTGSLTLIATLGNLDPSSVGFYRGAVNITVSGREQIVFLQTGKRIVFPTDTTATLSTFTVPTGANLAAYYVGYNDKVIYVENNHTTAHLFAPVSGTNSSIASLTDPGSQYNQYFASKLYGGDGFVAFMLVDTASEATMYYKVIQYDVVNDVWSTPLGNTNSTYSITPTASYQATDHLISNTYHAFVGGDGHFIMPFKYLTGGMTTVLTPINDPTYDEGRVMQDGSTYTCYTETAKALGATDITLSPTTKVYTGPSVEQRFVNDSSFGVIYEPDLTSGNMVGIDSIRINVRYLNQPSASATPPAMNGANGYTSVAFSGDGVQVVFGSVNGALDYDMANTSFDTTPHTISGGVGGRAIFDVEFTPNGYVAVGANGLVIVQDGINGAFNVVNVGTTDAITSVVYEPRTGSVVASTAGGATLVSPNGSGFMYIPTALAEDSYAMAVTPTAIVRVGANGSIYRSTDGGYTWTTITSPTANDLFAVHYDSLNLVAVGENGTIIYSSDNGLTWTTLTSGTTNDLYAVVGEANVFIAAGEAGTMLTSQNGGYNWSTATSGTTSDIRAGAVAGGTYYLVGDESVIITGGLITDMSMVPEDDAAGMDDEFSVIVNYYNSVGESARSYGGVPEVLIENVQEEYSAFVPSVTASVTASSTIGEDATLHEAHFTNPHVLTSSYKTIDAFSRTYGILLLIEEALAENDTHTAAALAFILTMAEQMGVADTDIVGGKIVLELSEQIGANDTESLIASLRATLSEGLASGMLFGPNAGTSDPDNNPEDDVWDCWVINTETRDTTTYNNFFFTSMAEVDGKVYTTDGATIYMLGGDTDAGTIIPAEIELPISDFNDSHLKNVNRVYLGMWADGKMALKTITEGNVERWYELEARRDGIHEYRVPLPKGVKSRYWSFQIGNVMGGDFSLESVTILPVVLSRRVR